jgi:hypothetical protein
LTGSSSFNDDASFLKLSRRTQPSTHKRREYAPDYCDVGRYKYKNLEFQFDAKLNIDGIGGLSLNAINSNGTVLALADLGLSNGGTFRAIMIIQPNGQATLLRFPDDVGLDSADAISNVGYISGDIYRSDPVTRFFGFVISPNNTYSIQTAPPGEQESIILQVVNDKKHTTGLVVKYPDTFNSRSFWADDAGHHRFIEVPGANFTWARGINNSDIVSGAFSDSTYHGFTYNVQTDSFTTIDIEGARSTELEGRINNLGDVVGLAGFREFPFGRAFVRLANGVVRFVDVSGSTQTILRGINDQRVVVGNWLKENTDNSVPFVATPTTRIPLRPSR